MLPIVDEIYKIIREDRNERKTIVETGFWPSTLISIARWVKIHPQSTLDSAGLNIRDLDRAHAELESHDLAAFCTFHLQDSRRYIQTKTWIDMAFLNSNKGLGHALEEFNMAASAGASTIVLTNYQSNAAHAIAEAKNLGWQYSPVDKYFILRRPNS